MTTRNCTLKKTTAAPCLSPQFTLQQPFEQADPTTACHFLTRLFSVYKILLGGYVCQIDFGLPQILIFFSPKAQTSEVWFSAIWPEPIFREGLTTLTRPKIASQS